MGDAVYARNGVGRITAGAFALNQDFCWSDCGHTCEEDGASMQPFPCTKEEGMSNSILMGDKILESGERLGLLEGLELLSCSCSPAPALP